MRSKLFVALLLVASAFPLAAKPTLEQIAEFAIPEANQGIGVDEKHFYAIDNRAIIHLDSAMLMNGKIYCAHSNYPQWPMTSSVEIWDAGTLEHVGSYGHKVATQMVKMTPDFRVVQAWVMPKAILDRFEEMSNSGGSWGPDGFLYLSGHDPAEIYKMRLPKAGSVLELVEVLPMKIRGQGIAWDRSERNVIYGIIRATAAERAAGGGHKVTAFRLKD